MTTNFEWTKNASIEELISAFSHPMPGAIPENRIEYVEPVSVYAESNIEDTIKCWDA